ncbi:hypothetical protein HDU76_006589 [Blyttiomyces sp. JEL0837]|nr:hypothetical protein HDU76_006589 [Blyttiomyces sp. JEL0837]
MELAKERMELAKEKIKTSTLLLTSLTEAEVHRRFNESSGVPVAVEDMLGRRFKLNSAVLASEFERWGNAIQTVGSIGDERTVQSIFNSLLPETLTQIESPFRFHKRPNLYGPIRQPDIAFTLKDCLSADWKTLVCNAELKVPGDTQLISKGSGQAISGMSLTRNAQPGRNVNISFFSNVATISFMSMTKEGNRRTNSLELFSLTENMALNAVRPAAPSLGFTALLELLASTASQLGYEEPPKFIQFKKSSLKVLGKLGAGADSEVYVVEHNSRECALKCPQHKSPKLKVNLAFEARNLTTLREKLGENSQMIPVMVDVDVNNGCLLISPAGTPLLAYIDKEVTVASSSSESNLLNDSVIDARCRIVQTWSKHWLLALSQIHQLGKVCHNDMRPQNVVVHESRVIIIDWESMSRIDQPLERFPCNPFFMSTRLLKKVHGELCIEGILASPLDDLETLSYGMVYLLKDGSLPWKTVEFASLEAIDELIRTRDSFMQNYGGFVSRFYLAVKGISRLPTTEDYDMLLNTLSD